MDAGSHTTQHHWRCSYWSTTGNALVGLEVWFKRVWRMLRILERSRSWTFFWKILRDLILESSWKVTFLNVLFQRFLEIRSLKGRVLFWKTERGQRLGVCRGFFLAKFMWFFCTDEGSIFTYSNYLPHNIEGKRTLIFINWQGFFKDFVM